MNRPQKLAVLILLAELKRLLKADVDGTTELAAPFLLGASTVIARALGDDTLVQQVQERLQHYPVAELLAAALADDPDPSHEETN